MSSMDLPYLQNALNYTLVSRACGESLVAKHRLALLAKTTKQSSATSMDTVGNIVSEQAEYQYESPRLPVSLARRIAALIGGSCTAAGALAVIDQAMVSGTSFLTSVIVGRMCSPEELGVYYLAISFVLFIFGSFNRMVFAPYTVYCGRRSGADADEYAGSILMHHVGLTLLTVGGLQVAAIAVWMRIGPHELKSALWILLAAMPLLLARQFARDFTFAHLHLGRALVIDGMVAVVQLCGLVALAEWNMLSVETAFAAMAAACAIASLFWIATKEQAFFVSRRRILGDWFHNWSLAKWSLAGHVTSSMATSVIPWIVLLFHGKAATGILAAAWSLGGMTNLFVIGIDSYLAPKTARAFIEGGTSELRRVLRWANTLFLVTVGLSLLVFLMIEREVVVLTYGEKYTGIGPIVAMLILSVLIRSIGMVASNGLWAMEQPRANFVANFSAAFVAVCLAIALVPGLAVVGAVLATLAGAIVGTAMRGVYLRRSLDLAFAKEQS